MKNKRFSELIEDLRFTSNKISDQLDNIEFDSWERRKIREVQDILDNKVFEMEDFKNEEEEFFYKIVGDFFLQRKQMETIEHEKYGK